MPYFRINGNEWKIPDVFEVSLVRQVKKDLSGSIFISNPNSTTWSGGAISSPYYVARFASGSDQAWITRDEANLLEGYKNSLEPVIIDTDLTVPALNNRLMRVQADATFSLTKVDPIGIYWRYDIMLEDI